MQSTAIRDETFLVSVISSSGLITDWDIQSEFVQFIARLSRSQVSLVLAGHGYIRTRSGPVLLRPGDVVESDQRLGEYEAYGGSPCEVVLVEWDDDTFFGPGRRGAPRFSRINNADVAGFRDLVARFERSAAGPWVDELWERLAAIGLPVRESPRLEVVDSRSQSIYRFVGAAAGRLDDHPSLTELADSLGVTERQARREIKRLVRDYKAPYDGWRDMLSDARMGWSARLLSIPSLRQKDVALLAGFRSDAALAHAFSQRGVQTPAAIRRKMIRRLG